MVNTIYRAAMTELETILSPRVVSRSLNAGLKQVGKSPKDVEYRDMEKILKSHIYKQLQVAMKAEKAKEKISDILERLESVGDVPSGPPPFLEQQERNILGLQKAFKLFSLYFEWPEVQKSRALLKLIEEEHSKQKEASQLIANARLQLKLAEEKLNDQLVAQAAEIQRLEEAYEAVKNLEGTKVRRLGRIIGQVKNAQADKQLAPAELERARKLASDLRAVVSEEEEKTQPQASETSAKILKDKLESKEGAGDLLADLDNQTYELEALGKDYANLTAFKPEFAQRLEDAKQKLSRKETLEISIVDLRQSFNEAQNQLRQNLKNELSDLQKDVLGMDDELDSQQLKQNLQVTLDVLENTLPAEADVREIHDLHRLLKQRASKLTQVRVQEKQSLQAKLEKQGEILEQLTAIIEKYDPNIVKKEYNLLASKLESLAKAQQEGELTPELVDEARHAAEDLETAILKKSLSESKHQEAYLGSLLMQVQAVPVTKVLKKQADKVVNEFSKSLKQLESRKELKPKRMEQLEKLASDFRDNAKLNYKDQLLRFKEHVQTLDHKNSLKIVDEALEQLEDDKYPDIEGLELLLKNAFDERLAENLDELHQLEAERQQISQTQDEEIKKLDTLLQAIRKQLEKGELAKGIDQCWLLLGSLRDRQQQTLTSFEPRLDEALKNFSTVSKLNNDTTATVSRILRHLDGQRETFSKVSAEMRGKLESALGEAESLMETLKEELEAASAVAGKLMSGNILDNVFGLEAPLSVDKATEQTTPEPLEEQVTKVLSKNEVLDEWLNSYLKDDEVRDAVIFSPSGEMLVGYTLLEPKELFAALKKIQKDWQVLGEELTLGSNKFFTIETAKLTLIASCPKENYSTAIVLNKSSNLNSILSKIRSDLPAINDVLSGPAFA